MEFDVKIERLGAQGDGVAQGPDGPLFVPFTLPGELVRVVAKAGEPRAEPLAIVEHDGKYGASGALHRKCQPQSAAQVGYCFETERADRHEQQ